MSNWVNERLGEIMTESFRDVTALRGEARVHTGLRRICWRWIGGVRDQVE